MTRRTATFLAVLTLVLLGTSVVFFELAGPARDAESEGRSFMAELAQGTFVFGDLWLDLRDLYIESAQRQTNDAWTVPTTRFLVVEEGWGGWGEPEEWGAWGLGESTHFLFFLPEVRPYDFFLRSLAVDDPLGRTQSVTVRVNGRDVESWTVPNEWHEHRFAVPEDALLVGRNELELRYDFHIEGIAGQDNRPLALAFERLGLLLPDETPREDPRGPGFVVQEDRETLLLAASGSYVVPIRLGRVAAALELEIQAVGGVHGKDEMSLQVGVLTLDGDQDVLLEIDEKTDKNTVYRLDLKPYRDSRAFLFFTAEQPPGHRYVLRHPRLVTETESSQNETAREAVEEAKADAAVVKAERPHIVVIVLDAARVDHFGLYGYSRDTTPVIDLLGEESLVFTSAVAECSYTVCSMPNLLTGYSYVQHGLIIKDLFLGEKVEPLAERLAGAGYRTLGFTGNPNNSTITGMERGYEEFLETWVPDPRRSSEIHEMDPRAITDALRQRLAAGPGDRPLFLMLHYVPPHEPYAPKPEFDIFGDPAYAGPVTSDRVLTRAIYDQAVELTDADLAELVALYDGNLRMADATVGEVLEILREAGIYDDTLVVVTSDHGEAFQEHGFIGHNTTVYDEMLRVPLVVKPPASWTKTDVATDRLVSLADVVATVDARLGLPAPPAAQGRDLLATISNSDDADRVLFLRSARSTSSLFGARTRRFKAIVQAWSLPELYDVLADPDERHNIVAERPLLHAGLMVLLTRAIEEEGQLRAGVREGEISVEQRDLLRTLGYLGD